MAKPRSKIESESQPSSSDSPGPSPNGEEPQDIEILRRRYEDLRDRKTTAEANLKTAQRHLDELKKEARDKYQTDDLEELKVKLECMKAENKTKREEYERSLNTIEQTLKDVEAKYAESQQQDEEDR